MHAQQATREAELAKAHMEEVRPCMMSGGERGFARLCVRVGCLSAGCCQCV